MEGVSEGDRQWCRREAETDKYSALVRRALLASSRSVTEAVRVESVSDTCVGQWMHRSDCCSCVLSVVCLTGPLMLPFQCVKLLSTRSAVTPLLSFASRTSLYSF